MTVVDATNQAGIQPAREIFMLIYLVFFVAVKMHWKTLRDTLCNCRWGCDLILSLKPPAALPPVRQSTTCCFFSLFLLLAVFCLAAAGWLVGCLLLPAVCSLWQAGFDLSISLLLVAFRSCYCCCCCCCCCGFAAINRITVIWRTQHSKESHII